MRLTPEVLTLFGTKLLNQASPRDVSGGVVGTLALPGGSRGASLDGDSWVDLPHASFPLVFCYSYKGSKVSALVALGNAALFSHMREYLTFKEH